MIKEFLASLIEIIADYIKHRLFPVTVVIVVLFSILINRLFELQIVEGEEHNQDFIYKSEKTLTVEAVRGNIYDRNGKLLAYNELSYSVVYSNDPLLSEKADELGISDNDLKNQIIYKTIQILETNGDSLYVDFPIKINDSGDYEFTVKDTQLRNFLKNVYGVTDYDYLTDEEKNSTAADIVDYLGNDMFEISDEYTKEEALKILSCRYKLWLNRFQQYVPVTIAYNLSEESTAIIAEYSEELIGIDITVKSLRRYNDAIYFAHIIGYIGQISSDEMTQYNADLPKDKQYTNQDSVGKIGIEQYCEEYLRGQNGYEIMYVDNLGKVIETVESTPAIAGNDVYLTIDADLQKYCYDTLEKEIAAVILENLVNLNSVNPGSNAKIAITDVYYGLFDNNIISMYDMGDADATDLEKEIYSLYTDTKEETLSTIYDILTKDFTPVGDLPQIYQTYMEYICEILRDNGIFNTSLISSDSQEYKDYTEGVTSLESYLKYAISIEAIDISSLDVDSSYYDTDEIYQILCDYIVKYLDLDTEFDKLIIKEMLQSTIISGYDVVKLIYDQGVLSPIGDKEYTEFMNGAYGPYEFMVRKISNLEITPAMLALDTYSGSVIVTDVNTGDVLAMVTYPSYDNNYLTNEVNAEYYNRLLEDRTTPLINRATMQRSAPGSTYKPLMSVAGLSEGVIDLSTTHFCGGLFEKLYDPAKCWIYPGWHGLLDVREALQRSCNIFFYEVGYSLALDERGEYIDSKGVETIAKYAAMFGFDDYSGVELPEISPHISDMDAVRSSIGQGTNAYAPIQISRYVTTIANSGTCYNLTLIDKVTDYEGTLLMDNQATVHHELDVRSDIWSAVHEGMRRVISIDTSAYDIINLINVNVAGKTGTAQESEVKPDHAVFISFAPYEAPEVSVTCVLRNGYHSSNAKEVAGYVYAYMYDPAVIVDEDIIQNVLDDMKIEEEEPEDDDEETTEATE